MTKQADYSRAYRIRRKQENGEPVTQAQAEWLARYDKRDLPPAPAPGIDAPPKPAAPVGELAQSVAKTGGALVHGVTPLSASAESAAVDVVPPEMVEIISAADLPPSLQDEQKSEAETEARAQEADASRNKVALVWGTIQVAVFKQLVEKYRPELEAAGYFELAAGLGGTWGQGHAAALNAVMAKHGIGGSLPYGDEMTVVVGVVAGFVALRGVSAAPAAMGAPQKDAPAAPSQPDAPEPDLDVPIRKEPKAEEMSVETAPALDWSEFA